MDWQGQEKKYPFPISLIVVRTGCSRKKLIRTNRSTWCIIILLALSNAKLICKILVTKQTPIEKK